MARKQSKQEVTEQDVETAIESAKESLQVRRNFDAKFHPQGFAAWGNDKCISRTKEAIDEMERGVASERRIRYWQNH